MLDRVAVCLGFRNWHVGHLARALAGWMRARVPVVVVDLGTAWPDISRVRATVAATGARLIEAPREDWSRSEALNLAAAAAPEAVDTLVFTDADMLVPESWFDAVAAALSREQGRETVWLTDSRDLPEGAERELWWDPAWLWRVSRAHPRVGQGAAMVVPRAWFTRVGGFDEVYRVWGAEDNDLVLRAEWDGVPVRWLEPPEQAWVAHQWHRRDWPTAAQYAQVQKNRAYLAERIGERGPVVRNRVLT